MSTRHIVLLICICLIGCSSSPPPVQDMGQQLTQATTFIQDGQTTREQVLLKLGIPSRQFESGRILGWRVCSAGEGLVTVSDYPGEPDLRYNSWPAGTRGYDLIVVFDGGDRVEAHSLVLARR